MKNPLLHKATFGLDDRQVLVDLENRQLSLQLAGRLTSTLLDRNTREKGESPR